MSDSAFWNIALFQLDGIDVTLSTPPCSSLPATICWSDIRSASADKSSTGRSISYGWMAVTCVIGQADRFISDNTAIAAACPCAIESSIVSGPVADPATKTPAREVAPIAP